MKPGRGIVLFGITEIIIGATTLGAVMLSVFLGKSAKPAGVLIFVLASSAISVFLGLGVLKRRLSSYHLLLFFSTLILLSKILIFAKIISLSGALETALPQPAKNLISVIYHSCLIFYFTRLSTREQFGEKRGVLFSLKLPFSKK